MKKFGWIVCGLFLLTASAEAAVCTSLSTGSWNTAARWSCGHVPATTDTVVIAHNITMNLSPTVAGLTVNAGMTLDGNGGNTVTVTGNLVIDGAVSNSARLNVTGAASVISGAGTITNSRLYTTGAAVSIAAGSALNFTGSSRLYAGRTSGGTTVAGSVLTINGTINSSVTSATTNFLRLYASNTVIGATGVINAAVSAATYNTSTAKVTNNGSVTLQRITQNAATNSWTQGVNSSLSVSAVSTVGTLVASATGNTVTYTAPATPIVPSGNTYFNLAGSGVTCPHTFTVLGSNPCTLPPGAGFVVSSPGSCSSLTGVGTIPWVTPMNATVSDNLYATAAMAFAATTNYLNCTGFNFAAIPAGATITGITVNIERRASRSRRARDAFVYMIKAGAINTAFNGATVTQYTTADVIEAHGASNNLWGTTWTPTDVKAANFGVAYAATSTRGLTVSVDHLQVRIDYTTSPVDHVLINAPANAMTSAVVPVVISPHSSTHAVVSGTPLINLSTSTGSGDWSIITGAGTFVPGAANSGLASYTYAAGETSATFGFSSSAAGTVTLNVAGAGGVDLLASTPIAEKANVINFSVATFVFTSSACVHNLAFGSPGQCALVNWSPRTAGQALANVYITSVDTAGVPTRLHPVQPRTRNLQFALSCHDPIAHAGIQATFSATATSLPLCASNGALPASWSTGVDLTFAGGSPSTGPYSFRYDDVGRVELWLRNSAATTERGSSGTFVVKPADFVLSNIKRSRDGFLNPAAADATGTAFVKAGEAFTATVTAVNAVNVTTPNFGKELAAESVKLVPTLKAGLGLLHNPAVTCADPTTATICDTTTIPGVQTPKFGAFVNGVATGVNFAWDEVGVVTLAGQIGDADYLGAGDVTGTASANIGRFYLGKFALQNAVIEDRTDLCDAGVLISDGVTPCSAFTYMDEQADAFFSLVPTSLKNAVVQNYIDSATATNDFAKLDPTIFAGLNVAAVDRTTTGGPHYLTARISNAGVPAASCLTAPCFQNGEATVSVPFKLVRNAAADGVYTAVSIGISATDSDGAAVEGVGVASTGLCNNPNVVDCYDLNTDATAGNDRSLIGVTEFRHGRSRVSNVHGSERLPLPLMITAEYWNGTSFVVSSGDNISSLTLLLNNYQRNLTAALTTLTVGLFVDGKLQASLSAPGDKKGGSVDISVTSPSYLPGNTGRATFGAFKGPNELIYLREAY